MTVIYVINFLNNDKQTQRIYLKEDGNPYFYDIWNAELIISHLKQKHPSYDFWMSSMAIKDTAEALI